VHFYSYHDQKEKFVKEHERIALEEEAKRMQALKQKELEDNHRAAKNKKDEDERQRMMAAARQSGEKVSSEHTDRKSEILNSGWGSRTTSASAAAPTIAPAASATSTAPAWGSRTPAAAAAAASPAPTEGQGAVGGRWGSGGAGGPARDGQSRGWGQPKPGEGPPRSGGWGKVIALRLSSSPFLKVRNTVVLLYSSCCKLQKNVYFIICRAH
jgi:hypothetical protein